MPCIHTGTGAAGHPRIYPHFRRAVCPKVTLKRQSQPPISLTKMTGVSASFPFRLLPITNIRNRLWRPSPEKYAVLTQSIAAWQPHCAAQRPGRHHASLLPSASVLPYPKTAKNSGPWDVHPDPPPSEPRGVRSRLSGVNWWTRFGKSLSHSEQTVHFRGSHRNQKLKQVINIRASLPRRGLMLISLSHLCFLFSWNSLIFHNAGNSTLFDQNSLKLSNEFQLPVYLVFQLASPPRTFQEISKLGLKPHPTPSTHPNAPSSPPLPHPHPQLVACFSPRPCHFLWS